MTWKTGGHAHDATMLVLGNGMLGTDTRIVPRNKIQYATSTANPFQRRLGLASVSVRTAAGAGGTAISLRDVSDATALEILSWVEPRTGAADKAGPALEGEFGGSSAEDELT
jgi:putative membrane protein